MRSHLVRARVLVRRKPASVWLFLSAEFVFLFSAFGSLFPAGKARNYYRRKTLSATKRSLQQSLILIAITVKQTAYLRLIAPLISVASLRRFSLFAFHSRPRSHESRVDDGTETENMCSGLQLVKTPLLLQRSRVFSLPYSMIGLMCCSTQTNQALMRNK